MSGTFHLLQQWQLPSTKLFLRSRTLPKDSASVLELQCYTLCFNRRIQASSYEIVRKSYIPTTQKEQETDATDQKSNKLEKVGAFQKLPMVMPSIDILYSAMRKAKKVSPTKGIANIAKRERNRGAKQLDALMKELAVPLRGYMENFPDKRFLHPYERSLIELTLGEGNYEKVLGRIDSLRKKVVSVGKQQASLCAKSSTKREAEERLNEGVKKVEEAFQLQGKAVDDLVDVAKTLRAMPVVDPETPTLCLVGAPNVGKSSLVRVLSTGKPEDLVTRKMIGKGLYDLDTHNPDNTLHAVHTVDSPLQSHLRLGHPSPAKLIQICNYPFTTRGILMGHIIINYERFQVTDTPGILKRHDDERNNLEKLTLAVLTHLPTAIMYVHDLSGECGMSPSDQFLIYKEMRDRFKNYLWLDVVSKCDLLKNAPESVNDDNDELARYKKVGPQGAIHVSVTTDAGINELQGRVQQLLVSQMERLKSQESSQDS